jgi:hypothetical protein
MKAAHKTWTSSALPLLVVAGASCCVVLPFLWLGLPSGHDFEFHLNSWIEVLHEWKLGVFYPHWSAMSHYGYGEARFIFYPPFSWTLGAALGAILPWKLVPAAYVCIVLTLAGYSMLVLAREWLPRTDAMFAAALFALNPYHIVIVYWRSAWAELMISIYLPLLLLLVLRLDQERLRIVPPLALLLGAGWLTNVPGAVMMNYSLALLVLCIAIEQRSAKPLLYGTLAAGAGALVASVYLLPVLHQREWVHLAQVLSPGVSPHDNFLFAKTTDAYHDRFNFLVSVIATWEIALVALLFVVSRRLKTQRLWWLALAWTGLAVALMCSATFPLWNHLPELRYVQLPWRWLLCLGVPFALVSVMALRHWWSRALAYGVMLGVIMLCWYRVEVPWWDKAADIQEMVDNEHDGIGNEGTDEYVPVTADSDEANDKAPLVRYEGGGDAKIDVTEWNPEFRLIRVNTTAPGRIMLRLFNYPLWRVTVNNVLSQTETASPSGQMVVPLAAGKNLVGIRFVGNWDRKIPALISVLSVLTLVFLSIRKRERIRLSAA